MQYDKSFKEEALKLSDEIGVKMSIPGGFTPQFRRLETGVPM